MLAHAMMKALHRHKPKHLRHRAGKQRIYKSSDDPGVPYAVFSLDHCQRARSRLRSVTSCFEAS
jgi:hypothetical protein